MKKELPPMLLLPPNIESNMMKNVLNQVSVVGCGCVSSFRQLFPLRRLFASAECGAWVLGVCYL